MPGNTLEFSDRNGHRFRIALVDQGDGTVALHTSSGGMPRSTYQVSRVTGIGSSGMRVCDGVSWRRVVKNIGSTTLEIVADADATYGTGFPLEAGDSFVFDDAGLNTAPIYMASSQAGGAVAVLVY